MPGEVFFIRNYWFTVIVLISAILVAGGCVTTSDPGEIVIVSSHDSRPDWTFTPKEAGDEHRYRYFVGLSEYQPSEQKARNQARKNVRQKIAQYLEGTLSKKRRVKISPAKLSGSFNVQDIYIQKVFRVEGYLWKVYVLAGFQKKLLDSKEKFIESSPPKQDIPPAKAKKKQLRIKWKNNYAPRAGSTSLSPDGQLIYASSHYPEGDLYVFDRKGNVKWKKQLPGRYGGWPTVGADGTLYYVKNTDAGAEWTIYAFSSEGKKLWEYADNCVFRQGLAIGPDGTLYVGSMKGRMGEKMYALSPEGRLKWKKQLGSRLVAAPVVASDGTVYQTGYNKRSNRSTLYALTPDGSVKWTYRVGDTRFRELSLTGNGDILVSDYSGGLHAVSPAGEPRWSAPTNESLQAAPVIGPDGTIYVATHGNELFAFTPEGNRKWSRELPGDPAQYIVKNTPVVDDAGYLYVTNYRSIDAGYLSAITPRGKLDWKIELDGGGHQTGNLLLAKDGTILATTHSGSLYAVRNSTGKGLATSPWPAYQHDNQNTGRVKEMATQYGTIKWKRSIKSEPSGEAVKSSAVLDKQGNVYFVNDGVLYSYSPTGELKWQYQPAENKGRGTPVISGDGVIVVSNGEGISGIDKDGRLQFEYTDLEGISSVSLGPEGRYYLTSSSKDGYLAVLDKQGELKWKFKVNGQDRKVTGCAVGADGTAYFTTKARLGRGYGYFRAVNSDGSLKWKFRYEGESRTTPAIGKEGTVYVTITPGGGLRSTNGHLYAFTPEGELKWKFKTGSEVTHLNDASYRGEANPVIGPEGRVYVASNRSGELWALDRNGNKKWKFDAGSPIRSTPAIGIDGTLYFGTDKGSVYALDSRGEVKWRTKVDARVFSSPALSPDGTLYLAGWDDMLYALRTSSSNLAESLWPVYQRDNQNSGRARRSSGKIWYVNDNSLRNDVFTESPGKDSNSGTEQAPFRTITHALEKASPGDKIKIDAGTYEETITINKKNLTIVGADSSAYGTVLDGGDATKNSARKVIKLQDVSGVEISNLRLINAYQGIWAKNIIQCEFREITIRDVSQGGLYFRSNCDQNIIENCRIEHLRWSHFTWRKNAGILFHDSDKNIIWGCHLLDIKGKKHEDAIGIRLSESEKNRIVSNVIKNIDSPGHYQGDFETTSGFLLKQSDGNIFLGNLISKVGWNSRQKSAAIVLGISSENKFIRNELTENRRLVFIKRGGSKGNIFKNNNFFVAGSKPANGIYNITEDRVNFVHNYWGTTDAKKIKSFRSGERPEAMKVTPFRLRPADTTIGVDIQAPPNSVLEMTE